MANEQSNRMALASRIAFALQQTAKAQYEDPVRFAHALTDAEWKVLGEKIGTRDGYVPSSETRELVLAFVRHGSAQPCITCTITAAERGEVECGRCLARTQRLARVGA